MNDFLVKGIINDSIRVYAVVTTNLVEEARQRHDTWPTASAALGRVLTVATFFGANIKNDNEKITIQINGGGPLGTVTVDAYSDGRVRGFVGDPHVHLIYNDSGKLAVGQAVGTDGYLRVIRDIRLKDDFTGTVALQTGEIGEDFAYYFTVSEQIPTALSVGVLVDTDNSVIASGGVMLQMLPNANDEDIALAEKIIRELKPVSELINEGNTAYDLINLLDESIKIIGGNDVYFECDCSKEKIYSSLSVLTTDEIKEIIDEDGGCEVVCNYCNNKYEYTKEELERLLDVKMVN